MRHLIGDTKPPGQRTGGFLILTHNVCYASFCFFCLSFWYNENMKKEIEKLIRNKIVKSKETTEELLDLVKDYYSPKEEKMRRDLDKEQRELWEKVIFVDLGILGVVLPLLSSQDNFILYPKIAYCLFLLVLLMGIFLLWLENKRQIFILDFSKVIRKEFRNILEGYSDDKWHDLFELFRIEKRYGFNKHIKGFTEVYDYLKPDNKYQKKLDRLLKRYWPKHQLHERTFMRFLYLLEPYLVVVFYFSFIIGILLLSIKVLI